MFPLFTIELTMIAIVGTVPDDELSEVNKGNQALRAWDDGKIKVKLASSFRWQEVLCDYS